MLKAEKHIGSSLDKFLEEEGWLKEFRAIAIDETRTNFRTAASTVETSTSEGHDFSRAVKVQNTNGL